MQFRVGATLPEYLAANKPHRDASRDEKNNRKRNRPVFLIPIRIAAFLFHRHNVSTPRPLRFRENLESATIHPYQPSRVRDRVTCCAAVDYAVSVPTRQPLTWA